MADEKKKNCTELLIDAIDRELEKERLKMSTTNNSGQTEYIQDDDRKIFVGGLDRNTTENDLKEHFGQFGEIELINVKINAVTGQGRGFAFIVFKTIQGLDNALACTNHVILYKRVDPKKAVPQQIKLFVGGLSLDLTDDDIKDYFKRYAPLVAAEMPYDKVKNQRKRFCFLTFDSIKAVTEILKSHIHVINGAQVYVRKAAFFNNYRMVSRTLRSMGGMQENFRGQRGREGFPAQYGHASNANGHYHGRYNHNQNTGYRRRHINTHDYQGYSAGAEEEYSHEDYEPSARRGGHGNQNVE